MKAPALVWVALVTAALSLLATADRLLWHREHRIAVVDVESVFAARQVQLTLQLTTSENDEARARIQAEAKRFRDALPTAMDQLADECQCVVLDKTMLVGAGTGVPNLTVQLQRKVQ